MTHQAWLQYRQESRKKVQDNAKECGVYAAEQCVDEEGSHIIPKLQNHQCAVDNIGSGLNDNARTCTGTLSHGNTHQLYKKADEQAPGRGKDHFWKGVAKELPPDRITPYLYRHEDYTSQEGSQQQSSELSWMHQ
jgi:hypothetical protein